MNNFISNREMVAKWFTDKGDYTHNINYDLNENSSIMDFGGYTGIWAQQMIIKYNPYVYIVEPIQEYFNILTTKFSTNTKVHLLEVGVSCQDEIKKMFVGGDASSSNFQTENSVDVNFYKVETLLKKWNLKKVDLLQINIEGDEYPLLECMLKTGTINNFENIQVQFHLGIEDDIQRRNNILEGLISNGFKNKFDYPFVWESWTKNF